MRTKDLEPSQIRDAAESERAGTIGSELAQDRGDASASAASTTSVPYEPASSYAGPRHGDQAVARRARPPVLRRLVKRVLESNAFGRRLRAIYWGVREDLDLNDSLFSPGFQAVIVYRFGAWHRTLPPLLRKPCALIYGPMFVFVRNVYGIEIHATARIGRRFRIAHQHGIVLHPELVVGDDCVIRQNVTIGGIVGHKRAATLGNGVHVGAGAVIIGGVRIGDGARIGPNAVVMMDVPARSTAFAAPARIINVNVGRISDGSDSDFEISRI